MQNKIHAVYIGWPKCASTWFHRLCEASPDLAVSRAKDLNFFSDNYAKGVEWFFNQLDSKSSDARPIDINHDYIFSESALLNISKSSSSTKIVIFLRHPLDWLVSEFNYVTAVANVTCDFETYLTEYPYALEHCRYEELLMRVFQIFPKDSIFIGFQEDLNSDPISFAKVLTDFLDIQPVDPKTFDPTRKVNSGIQARFSFVPFFVRIAKYIFQNLGLYGVYGLVKRSFLRRLIFSVGSNNKVLVGDCLSQKMFIWSRQKRMEVEAVIGAEIESWRLRECELGVMLGDRLG